MKKKSILFLSLICLLTLNLQAIPKQLEMSNNGAVAAMEYMQQIKADLAEKAATGTLTNKELKRQKKINKRIAKIEKNYGKDKGKNRSWIVALLLSIFLGGLAIDRFYLGHWVTGIIKLITIGGLGLWYLIDIILIIVRALKPKHGSYID